MVLGKTREVMTQKEVGPSVTVKVPAWQGFSS